MLKNKTLAIFMASIYILLTFIDGEFIRPFTFMGLIVSSVYIFGGEFTYYKKLLKIALWLVFVSMIPIIWLTWFVITGAEIGLGIIFFGQFWGFFFVPGLLMFIFGGVLELTNVITNKLNKNNKI